VYTSYSPAYSYSYYGKKYYKKNRGRKWKDEVKDFIKEVEDDFNNFIGKK
jgi:hypothetical protein